MKYTQALKPVFDRYDAKLKVIENICKKVAEGDYGGMNISGPPGIGKTTLVTALLAKYKAGNHYVVKGRSLTALGLYTLLHKYNGRGDVLIFDDADIKDLDTINLLKAACDTNAVSRLVSYEVSSVDKLGLPRHFQFRGGIVILTNRALADEKKLVHHLKALVDRCFSIELASFDSGSTFKLIAYMLYRHNVLKQFKFNDEVKDELLEYIADNTALMKTVSLRSLEKLAQYRRDFGADWRVYADATLLSSYDDEA